MSRKIQQDQRGIAPLLLVVLAVVVIGAIGFVGYKVAKKNKSTNSSGSGTTSSTTTSKATASSACLAAYHDATLCKFAGNSAVFDKTAYTATLKLSQSGTNTTMTLASDGKGNNKLSSTGGGQTLNSITLNGKSYIQTNGKGPWIEYPSGTSAPTSDPTSGMNIGVGSSGVTFKSVGTATCGSLTCYEYRVADAATPTTTQYVWFDNSSYKLREWRANDSNGNTTDMVISYNSVNITAPSPVQSYTAPQ